MKVMAECSVEGAPGAARAGDVLSIALSGVCLVHCMALSLAAAALPLAGAWAQSEWVHWGLAVVAAALSGWTLLRQGAPSLSRAVGVLALSGVALLLLGAAETPSAAWGTGITVTGALMLIAAHTFNWRRHLASSGAPC